MTISAAVLWFVLSLFGTMVFLVLTESIRSGASKDLVNAVACQSVAYLMVVLAIVHFHRLSHPLGHVLAFRATHPALYLLGLLFGVAAQIPADLMQHWITKIWPDSPDVLASQAEMLRMDTTLMRIAIPVAAAVVGPVVEEVFFRGVLTWGLKRRYGAVGTALVVGALFAGAHASFKLFIIYMLLGMSLVYLRLASGSLIPPLLAHIGFNGFAIVALLAGQGLVAKEQPPPSLLVSSVGIGATLLVLGSFWAISGRSKLAQLAQSKDLE